MNSSSGRRWYVVQTHPHSEAKAQTHLARQGFFTYFPRYMKRRRHARRVETVAAPLFPRYLFVAIDLAAQRWHSIRSTIGVTRFVCQGQQPAMVPDIVVEALRAREDENGVIRLATRAAFQPGEAIRVLDGVFSDCFGLFEGMTDDERVTILLDMLGRKVRVVIDVESVAAA